MEGLLLLSLLCAIPLSLLIWSGYRLSSLLTSKKHAEITFPPHELRLQEVMLAVLAMIVKSVFNQTSGSEADANRNDSGMITLSSPFSITEEDISRYHQAVDSFACTGEISDLTLPLFLSAVTEPAMLLLLASPRCPINPLGAVNVRNRFEVLRPELCQPHLFMRQHSAGLVAKMRNGSRTVKRGVEYDLDVAIMVPDQLQVGNPALITVYRQVFTMLEFRKTNVVDKSGSATAMKTGSAPIETDVKTSEISFSGSEPLKWAALCKDYNPIHLAGLAAKMFGLPGKLAHGNHVVAKAIQYLEDDQKMQWQREGSYSMEVHFKRPLVVPAVLTVERGQTTNGGDEIKISCGHRESVMIKLGTLSSG